MSRFKLMENLPDLVIASTTTITMAQSYLSQPTRIVVGGSLLLYTSTTTINFATTGLNALDTGAIASNQLYYIYSVKSSGGVAGLVASTAAPATGPTGYTAWREIGRCRTLSSAATLATITNRIGGASSLTLSGSEWVSYTPTYANITTTSVAGKWRRIGDSMEVVTQADPNGSATGTITVSIPSGYTINTAALTGTGATAGNLGTAQGRPVNGASATWYAGVVQYATTTTVSILGAGTVKSTDTASGLWNATIPDTWAASGDSLSLHFLVPVAEFAGLYT